MVETTSTAPIPSEQPTTTDVVKRGETAPELYSVNKKEKISGDSKDLEASIAQDDTTVEEDKEHGRTLYQKFRPFILGGFVLLILAWWISATVLKATRHRWVVQTVLAWSFIS